MLKLGCTLPNLAKICSHKSTDYKFYPLFSSEIDLLEKALEYMTSGPAIVYQQNQQQTRRLFENQTTCVNPLLRFLPVNSILNRFVMICLPIGLYTRWDYFEEILNFKASLYQFRTFQNSVTSSFQASGPECKIESNCKTRKQKKTLIALVWMFFANNVRLFLKQQIVISISVLLKKLNLA